MEEPHTTWSCAWRTVSCQRDATLPQDRTVRSISLEEEKATEKQWCELGLTAIPSLSPSPVPRGGEEVAKLFPGRGSGGGKVYLRSSCFFSSLSYSDWIGDLVMILLFKLN